MKILVNTASSYKGGGIQVAKSYIEEFRKFVQNDYYVILSNSLKEAIDISNYPKNFEFFEAPFRPATKIFSFESHNSFLKEIEENWKPDIVFSTGGPSYWRPKVKHIMGFTIPHYVYPESPYFKLIGLKKKWLWDARKALAKFYFKRDADIIISQTDDITDRVKKLLSKDQVFTISNTINNYYKQPIQLVNKLPEKAKNEFRLLTLSAWYPHKNLGIMPKVLEELDLRGYKNILFIVTLPEEDFKKLGYTKGNLVNVGIVKIEEGASLYKECDAMFLPSLLECFSASYAEAMAMHKPILTSNLGFAHTVCGDAALYFDPCNAEDIASKVIQVYEDVELRKALIHKGNQQLNNFGTSENRAIRLLEICEEFVRENKK